MKTDVIVIGAGHNGLVAAFYLTRAGLSVQVLEAQSVVGGACKTEELIPGYRFSSCANILAWLRPRVFADMKLVERGLQVKGGMPVSRLIDRDRGMTLWSDPSRLEAEIRRFSATDARAWTEWSAIWNRAANLLGPYLLSYPPTLAQLQKRAEQLGESELLATLLTFSLAELGDRYFESPEMRGGVGAPHDVGSLHDHGSAMMAALGAASSQYSETGEASPVGFVAGGMGRLTQLMAQAAESHGAVIRTSSPVARVVVESGSVAGVELSDGTQIQAQVVLSAADLKRAFRGFLSHVEELQIVTRRVEQLRTDVAPLKMHLALSELPEFSAFPGCNILERGCLAIQPDRDYHERAWDDARHGRLPQSPFMLLMPPSVWDATLAPPGRHTLSIWMQYAPVKLAESSWEAKREEMADRIIRAISHYAPGFESKVLDRVLFTPADIESRVWLTDGNIHHIDLVPSQILWQRPCPELSRYRTPVRGFYLCGAAQHPFGEVSGGPGHNAAHVVLEDLERIEGDWEQISKVGATPVQT